MAAAVPTGFRALPLPIVQLSLAAVLQSGQSFRWSILPLPIPQNGLNVASLTHEYRLCLRDRVICLRQSPDTLFYRSYFPSIAGPPSEDTSREAETLQWLIDYFQLDIDLVKLYDQWSDSDPIFKRFRTRFEGIRTLRQDPWENLVSFICSSNNNISRITKMVHSLCKQYSPPLLSLPRPGSSTSGPPAPASSREDDMQMYYPFPPPSVLAAPGVSATLRALGFGYRAEFVQRTAKMLVDTHGAAFDPRNACEASEAWLKTLRNMATVEARAELLKFTGVGRKVADCILLMSLDKREVIPVDTHVHQIAIKHYGLYTKGAAKSNLTLKRYDEVSTKLVGVWGDYSGWAHSVLFTADLKSFSSYGLPTLSSSATPRVFNEYRPQASDPTPLSPLPSPSTRRHGRRPVPDPIDEPTSLTTFAGFPAEIRLPAENSTSLAERVKKRRRMSAAVRIGSDQK